MVDSVFEIIYTLFPLIYLTNNKGIFALKSLGLLRQTNPFFAIQAFMAIYFLSLKCWYLMSELDPAYIEYKYLKDAKKIKDGNYYDQTPWIITKQWVRYQTQREKSNRRMPFGDKLKQLVKEMHSHENNTTSTANTANTTNTTNLPSTTIMDRVNTLSVQPSAIRTNSATPTALSRKLSLGHGQALQPTDLDSNNDIVINDGLGIDDSDKDNLDNRNMKNGSGVGISDISDLRTQNSKQADDDFEQKCRKCCVMSTGFLIFGIGWIILLSFIMTIEFNFKRKCLFENVWSDDFMEYTLFENGNYESNTKWVLENKEILFYYQSNTNYTDVYSRCLRRVPRVFSEYPCNCREVRILFVV